MAVIGDEDLVNGLRLAGVSRYFVVEGDHSTGEHVRKALGSFLDDPDVGIVAIQEDYVKYVEDLVAEVNQRGKMTPVIIEGPPKYGTRYTDVTKYYREYIRRFIGFDIEI